MPWNIFGKKEPKLEIDPLHDLTIPNLKKGWVLDYDGKTWEVVAVHRYNWGDGAPTREWELRSGRETIFLEYEAGEGENFIVSRYIPIGKIDGNLKTYLTTHEDPPERITCQGVTYYLDEEGGGLFLEDSIGPEQEFLFWDFVDDSEDKFITIEQWGETEVEAYEGAYEQGYHFTNILPRETSLH